MSRKDTIIIALLINAGLLALLFMLAINTDDDNVSEHSEISKTIEQPSMGAPVQNTTPLPVALSTPNLPQETDEVDSFLKELSSDEMSQPILIDEEGYVEVAKQVPVAKPVVAEEPKTSSDAQYVEVTIKKGDALEKIARSNGTTVEAIKKANNLTSNKLTVGKTLRIPISKNSSPAAVAKTAPTPAPADTDKKAIAAAEPVYYTIKNGDNPWKVAKQNNVKFEDLLKLNGLNEEKARNMKAGDKIRVK